MAGGTALLAGCSSGNDQDTDTTETDSDPPDDQKTASSTKTTASGTVETSFTFPGQLTVGEQFTGTLTIENSTQSTAEIPDISLESESGDQTETLSLTESSQVPAGETVEEEIGPIVPRYAEELTVALGSNEFTRAVSVASTDGQTYQSDDGVSITVEPVGLYSNLLLKDTDDVYSPNSGGTLLRVNISAEGVASDTANDRFFVRPSQDTSVRFLQQNLSVAAADVDWSETSYQGRSASKDAGWALFEVPTQVLEDGMDVGWNRNPDNSTTEEVVWATSLSDGIEKADQTSHSVNWPTLVHKNTDFDVTADVENPSGLPYTFQASVSLSNVEGGPTTIDMDETVAPETTDQRTVATLSPSTDIETPGTISAPSDITVGPPRLKMGESYDGITVESKVSTASSLGAANVEYKTDPTPAMPDEFDERTLRQTATLTFIRISTNGVSPAPDEFDVVDVNNSRQPDSGLHYLHTNLADSTDFRRFTDPVTGELYDESTGSGLILLDQLTAQESGAVGWFPDGEGSTIMDAEAVWYTESMRKYQDEEDADWWR